jgi:Activator of Hsp90 ATPase homolog 1-like protein
LRWKEFGPERITSEDGGRVLKATPNRHFSFQWSPSNHVSTVDIRLRERGSGTLVTLVESGYDKSDEDLQTLVNCAVGCRWTERDVPYAKSQRAVKYWGT